MSLDIVVDSFRTEMQLSNHNRNTIEININKLLTIVNRKCTGIGSKLHPMRA